MTTVTIVTAWLDAFELIPGYWRALKAGLRDGDEVIVVDNASNPFLELAFGERTQGVPSEWITFVRFERNIGFSRACNVGLDRVGTDAVLFLNNDVRMSRPDWLDVLRGHLAPGVLVGAELRDGPHTAVDGVQHPYLDGWCLAGMRDDLLTLGAWNEDFEEPAYYGDNELCVRARALGFDLLPAEVGLRHLSNYTSRRMTIDDVAARNRERYVQSVRSFLGTKLAA